MITKEIFVTSVYDFLRASTARINIIKGGAGSSKSYSIAQHLILNKMLSGLDLVNVVIRKTLPALKKTAMKLIIDLLNEWEIPYKLNKTDLELRVKNSLTYFLSLDEPEKIKSLNINNAWLEETNELNLEDFRQIKLRLRRENKGINQIYCSFNPVSALSFIKTEIIDKADEDIAVNTSTYKDNPFLDKHYIHDLEDLINQDLNFYKIYTLGEWGVLENIIYGKWKSYNKVEFKDGVKFIDGLKVDDITYGLDFGFEHPSVLTEINWIENDFIVHELLYQSKLTNTELIEQVKKLIPEEHRYREIFADHSEPARINEFYQADFNIHKAKKDVLPGIDYCKTHLLGVTVGSINGIKELQSYKRRKDKDGHVMEEPVKASIIRDDFCDSFRYGAFSKFDPSGDSKLAEFSFR